MATTNDFAEYILDCVGDSYVTLRKMFGEYAVYYDKKVVGFICDNILFLKVTNRSEKFLEQEKIFLKRGPAYPNSKDYFIASEELLENKKFLQRIFLEICEDVPTKKKSKKQKLEKVKN